MKQVGELWIKSKRLTKNQISIKNGDLVVYMDTKCIVEKHKRRKVIKVPKIGIWDGEKVNLIDGDKTVVRGKQWLRKIKMNKQTKELVIALFY